MILRGAGYIPGLAGRLNPILDAHDRLYLCAKDIAIRDGEAQPAHFEVGVPMMLEDADGVVMQVRVLHIQRDISLLEYVQFDGKQLALQVRSRTAFRSAPTVGTSCCAGA